MLVISLLLAIALFLNYRPRYPIEFSTRYGKPPSRQEMVDAICRLRGEEVRGQLEPASPSDKCEFHIPATGESFRLEEAQVRSWKLGRYTPSLGVPAAPTEEYSRAFMRRYYPWVPTERMQRDLSTKAARSGRPLAYNEVTPEGTVLGIHRCSFTWDRRHGRLEEVYFRFAPLEVDAHALLSREQAERLAKRRALRTRWLIDADITSEGSEAATVYGDDLGVQRCAYYIFFRNFRWRRWAVPEPQSARGQRFDILLVDAQSGAAVPMMLGPMWQRGAFRQGISLDGFRGFIWHTNYPALRLWGVPYTCGKYLQSDLWAGKYSFDRKSGVFTVEHQGLRWAGRRGSPFLRGPEGLSMSWFPPRMIDGELYLPTTMVRRITGWTMSGSWGWLTLKPPGADTERDDGSK